MGTRADKETEIEQIRLRGFDIRCEYRSFVIPPLLIAIDKRKHHFFFFLLVTERSILSRIIRGWS